MDRRSKYIGFDLIFGLCLGAAARSLFGNVGLGMAFGPCPGIGIAILATRNGGKQ